MFPSSRTTVWGVFRVWSVRNMWWEWPVGCERRQEEAESAEKRLMMQTKSSLVCRGRTKEVCEMNWELSGWFLTCNAVSYTETSICWDLEATGRWESFPTFTTCEFRLKSFHSRVKSAICLSDRRWTVVLTWLTDVWLTVQRRPPTWLQQPAFPKTSASLASCSTLRGQRLGSRHCRFSSLLPPPPVHRSKKPSNIKCFINIQWSLFTGSSWWELRLIDLTRQLALSPAVWADSSLRNKPAKFYQEVVIIRAGGPNQPVGYSIVGSYRCRGPVSCSL